MEKYFKDSILHINDYELDRRLTLRDCLGKIIIKGAANLKMFNEALGNNEFEMVKEHNPELFEDENDDE